MLEAEEVALWNEASGQSVGGGLCGEVGDVGYAAWERDPDMLL